MSKPLVSILIPTHNRALLILETLTSVKEQTYKNWECILVDDGSTDNTVELIEKWSLNDSRFKVVTRPKNRKKGANACRNLGFEISKGDFIQWFDSDDIMSPHKIEEKVKILEEFKTKDYVVCEGIEFNETISNTFNKWDTISSVNPILDHITGKVNFHTNGPLFRRTFLENKKLFNEDLQRKQEWEFYTRLLFNSANYYPLHKTLYYFRIHPCSINGKDSYKTVKSRIIANNLVFKMLKNEKKILKKNYFLRKHFLYKYAYNIKLVKLSKSYTNFFYIVKGVLMTLNFKVISDLFLTLIKKVNIKFT
ncbi:glycosyltransferase family 2 protein [Polaribacter pectinis]|uniref:Glycosyltransferase family 2 protein n=1 Tax=Polaribacter pectinis TaxID=2738844 RepID=A0A7G9LCB1_9FLAO|nr:glycosyltransferase family 2 protein [Polaribacter pectinis]QNM86260.1 glycosyltransferase family 2 protein [Polaribacter pectinis]